MLSPAEQRIIQLELTNACPLRCSNCTRFCGHHARPFFMDLATFRRAVSATRDYPGMVGIMGGEPTLHPQFEKLARYFASKVNPSVYGARPEGLGPLRRFEDYRERCLSNSRPASRRGLWSSLGEGYRRHYELIQDAFEYQCLNDHSHDGAHVPLLVASSELPIPEERRRALIESCWINRLWSASVTPRGVFFCEIAAALDMLFGELFDDDRGGRPIEAGWWRMRPEDFGNQLRWCELCGAAMPLPMRPASDGRDDVSPGNLERLRAVGSPKIRAGQYEVFDVRAYDAAAYDPVASDPECYLPDTGTGKDESMRISLKTEQSLRPRRIDAVLVCVGYADYLRVTLPWNRRNFERVVVATTPSDRETQKVCADLNAECVQSGSLHHDGAPFNKGRLLNDAYAELEDPEWVLILDADVLLPMDWRGQIEQLILNPGCIHHTRRLETGDQHRNRAVHALATSGAKWKRAYGNVPLELVYDVGETAGFFQLVNARAESLLKHKTFYPVEYPTAGKSDVIFGARWPKRKRLNLPFPAFDVFHFPHGPARNARNWKGRTSPRISAPLWRPAPEVTAGGWRVLLRGWRPELWGTGILDDACNFGTLLPEHVESLRLTNLDTQEALEVDLQGDPGRIHEGVSVRCASRPGLQHGMWLGRLLWSFDAFHLGLAAGEKLDRRGSIILDGAGERGGFGFGHRQFVDDGPGYAWGVDTAAGGIEIACQGEAK